MVVLGDVEGDETVRVEKLVEGPVEGTVDGDAFVVEVEDGDDGWSASVEEEDVEVSLHVVMVAVVGMGFGLGRDLEPRWC